MNIAIPVSRSTKFNWIVDIMAVLTPFSELRPKEREVLAELYKLNDELKDIPEHQRALLLFHADNKKIMAENIGISVDGFYNIVMSLRKKGIITSEGIEKKYLLPNTDSITFKFVDTDESSSK
jgi:hypothetical protein